MLEEFGTEMLETINCCECGKKVAKVKAREIFKKESKQRWMCQNCVDMMSAVVESLRKDINGKL